MSTDEATQAAEPANATEGVIARLQARGEQLSKGRRLTLPMPGWADLGDGRGLWARFAPFNREQQTRFGATPNERLTEIEVAGAMIAGSCEEILIGTRELRTPLADEPGVRAGSGEFGPLGFGPELSTLLGLGSLDPATCIKRMLIHGDDDIPFFSVMGELLAWSGSMYLEAVETAAGE